MRDRGKQKNIPEYDVDDPNCYFDGDEYIALEEKVKDIMEAYPPDGGKWIEPRQVHALVGDGYTREWVEDAMRTTLCFRDPFSTRDRYQMSRRLDGKPHVFSLAQKAKRDTPIYEWGGLQ